MNPKTFVNKKTLLSALAVGIGAYFYNQKKRKSFKTTLQKTTAAVAISSAVAITAPAHAQMSESLVMAYAQNMQSAANARNIGQIARLLSDDVVVSLSRQGKGAVTLDKSGYLDLLQKSWTQADNYRYSISVDNIVVTGDTARAQVVTTETWTKDDKNTTLITTSKATLTLNGNNALLMRSVSQVTVN